MVENILGGVIREEKEPEPEEEKEDEDESKRSENNKFTFIEQQSRDELSPGLKPEGESKEGSPEAQKSIRKTKTRKSRWFQNLLKVKLYDEKILKLILECDEIYSTCGDDI